jgi:cysteine desulfurase
MAGADADTAGRPAGLDAGTVYLDYNGTTPVDTRVIDALLPYLHTDFGNPSSSHSYGQAPRAAMDGARRDVARLIGAAADQIVFTGSGSEADALAIRGTVAAAADSGRSRPHLISQATEHPAVLAACRSVARDFDGRVTVLPVDERGLVRPGDLEAVLDDDTVLVSIMHANNETGVIQPIAELAALAHGRGASFHTDAAQSVGKIPVDVAALDVDLLTLVGHKMYAPKGVAALYVRDPSRPLRPLVGGGGQERGRRAGTENVPYVVGLGTAARLLADALPGRVHVNGDTKNRLPHVLNVSIDGIAAHELLESCPTIAASTGSACHAGTHEPSPVLVAMGCSPERALAAIRLSLGRWSTFEDVVHAAVQITARAR